MKTKLLAVVFLFAAYSNIVHAQTIRQKDRNQRHRIVQGVKSGALTRTETKNLVKDQKEIRSEVKDARADGVVTKEERKDIRQDQRQESRKIFRKKHNGRRSNEVFS